jgi:hypothetical protein
MPYKAEALQFALPDDLRFLQHMTENVHGHA